MVNMISTSHAVLLLDFALKHQLAQITWEDMPVWKYDCVLFACECVRARVWLIIIIINILEEVEA